MILAQSWHVKLFNKALLNSAIYIYRFEWGMGMVYDNQVYIMPYATLAS